MTSNNNHAQNSMTVDTWKIQKSDISVIMQCSKLSFATTYTFQNTKFINLTVRNAEMTFRFSKTEFERNLIKIGGNGKYCNE